MVARVPELETVCPRDAVFASVLWQSGSGAGTGTPLCGGGCRRRGTGRVCTDICVEHALLIKAFCRSSVVVRGAGAGVTPQKHEPL
jgi:hypothetical protein